jgi:hypothetical protein
MTLEQLRRDLAEILAAEEASPVDWKKVSSLCFALSMRSKESVEGWDNSPHEIWHFMADDDIRKRDPEYADRQRQTVRNFIALQP